MHLLSAAPAICVFVWQVSVLSWRFTVKVYDGTVCAACGVDTYCQCLVFVWPVRQYSYCVKLVPHAWTVRASETCSRLCVALCLTGLTSDLWQTGCDIVTHQIYFLGFMCMDRSVLFVSCLYAGERSPELSHQNPGLDSRSWWERQWQYFQFVQNSNVIYRVHFGLGWDRMWFRLYVKKKSL